LAADPNSFRRSGIVGAAVQRIDSSRARTSIQPVVPGDDPERGARPAPWLCGTRDPRPADGACLGSDASLRTAKAPHRTCSPSTAWAYSTAIACWWPPTTTPERLRSEAA
jgi:hypothetical protein